MHSVPLGPSWPWCVGTLAAAVLPDSDALTEDLVMSLIDGIEKEKGVVEGIFLYFDVELAPFKPILFANFLSVFSKSVPNCCSTNTSFSCRYGQVRNIGAKTS